MANEFQNSIFKAIDTLLDKRVENLALDKTITATIDKCVNMIDNLYMINYQGGKTYAYAQANTSYTKDQEVYVLVPEGDFNKKKIIMGVATTIGKEDKTKYVSSILNDYNVVGGNLISSSSQYSYGLHSYLKEDAILLYSANTEENSELSINIDDVNVYLKQSNAISIRAQFNTASLPKDHRQSKKGNFGIVFEMVFKDASKYPEDGKLPDGANPSDYEKQVAYVLDITNMTGDPFRYVNDTIQYETYAFEPDTFLRIERIYAFSQGFEKETNAELDKLYGATIFIKNIELFGLKEISAEQDGYKLRISTPKGAIFKDADPSQYMLEAVATLLKDNVEIDGATYHWFREDARVDRTSENYNSLGGVGWTYLNGKEATPTSTFGSLKKNNRAYENNYLCVMDYRDEMYLKTQFTFYNNSNKREIKIFASPASRFSFDNGNVELTCKIKLDSTSDAFIDDFSSSIYSNYMFLWSRTDPVNGDIVFNKSIEELDAEIAKTTDMRTKLNLSSQKSSYRGASWDKNKLTYPVSSIDKTARFKCSVYVDGYLTGSDTISIENEDAADPTDYYIIIENGDQVFQYSESGVSPCDERYKDPLEVLNLKCHFIDPAGLEVDPKTYSIKWKFPLESTMLVVPKVNDKGVSVNPANEKAEWLYSLEYPTKIADNYDYQALNNQVEAIVLFHGVEYTKSTDFLFVKVGDNGTNGTDIVAKINVPYEADNEMPFIQATVDKDNKYTDIKWSDGKSLSNKKLEAILYQRNQSIDSAVTVTWDISGKQNLSKRMGVSVSDGIVSYEQEDRKNAKYSNQIVKATFRYKNENSDRPQGENTYYAFAGIPVVLYSDSSIVVKIDKRRTLKDILYNADGRNPMYNKNQGVFITLWQDGKEITDKKIKWRVTGGVNDLNNNAENNSCDITIMSEKDNRKTSALSVESMYDKDDKAYRIYVLPNDIYNGASCNNMIVATIDDEITIMVPIHMSLNTFGLASLNKWDGNHIEINEDSDYIMAPQIGAGLKDDNNRFTGIVMGTAQTYDQEKPQVGLLGYSDGEQSIFLNSEDGSAIFGFQATDVRAEPVKILDENDEEVEKPGETLSEPVRPRAPGSEATEAEKQEYEIAKEKYKNDLDAYRKNVADWENYWNYYYLAHENAENAGRYRYSEGRIELIPNGTSKIGNWRIGSTMLYNVMGNNSEGNQNELDKPYSDLRRANQKVSTEEELYKRSIPHQESGILISSAPTYVSIKGHKLRDKVKWVFTGDPEKESDLNNQDKYVETYPKDSPGDIDSTSGNAILYDGDSFELELNPNARSLFTIYRHSQNDDDWSNSHWGIPSNVVEKSVPWFRRAMVGIDNAGRFYTNSIKEEGAALTLNYLPAFGQVATTNFYRGVNIEIGKENDDTVPLIKFFGERSVLEKNLDSATVYISGGSRTNNEYIRPMSVHGKSIALYAEPDSSKMRTKKMTGHRLRLTNKWAVFGHYKTDDTGAPSTQNQDSFISCLELTTEDNAYSTLWSKSHLRIRSGENFTHTVGGNSTTSISGITKATFNQTTDITSIDNMTVAVGVYDKEHPEKRRDFKLSNYDYHLNLIHRTNKGFELGNDNDHIKLDDSGTKLLQLKTSNSTIKMLGWKSDIEILSKNSSKGGIKLQTSIVDENRMSESFELLAPQGHATLWLNPGGTGDETGKITLNTNAGIVTVGGTMGQFNKSNISGVIVSPGFGADFGYISGTFKNEKRDDPDKIPNTTIEDKVLEYTSFITQKDIRILNGSIRAVHKDAQLQIGDMNIGAEWLNNVNKFYSGEDSDYYRGYARETDLNNLSNSISGAGYLTKDSELIKKLRPNNVPDDLSLILGVSDVNLLKILINMRGAVNGILRVLREMQYTL